MEKGTDKKGTKSAVFSYTTHSSFIIVVKLWTKRQTARFLLNYSDKLFINSRFLSTVAYISRLIRMTTLVVLVILVILSLPSFLHAQEPVTQFEHITLDEGLSDNTVYAIVQDQDGFLWFGTQNGLNKFDGYNITVFRHNPFDENSVSNDNAGNLYIDHSGIIWIGTWGGGLDRFDPQSEQFTNYTYDPDTPGSLSYDRVQTMFEDRSGMLWVGTAGGGLNKFDRESETFSSYEHNPDDPNSLSNNRVWRIDEDHQGALWIATSDGLNKFDPQSEKFTHYRNDPDNPRSLSHSLIRTLYVDKSGTLWVGTEEGLNKFNPESNDFEVFLNDPADPDSLSDNIINAILEDRAGNLWIGTRSHGIDQLDHQSGKFIHHTNDPLDPNSLSYNDIRSIHEDSSGQLWVATRGGGVNKFLPTAGKITHFANNPNNPNSLNNNDVRAIYEDETGLIWIGTKGGGLNRFDSQTGQFTSYPVDGSANSNSLSSADVYAIYEDREGIFWLGMSGGGLNRFDPQSEQFTHYRHDPNSPNSLSSDDVYTIYEDQGGNLWLGTKDGGLNKFDRETGRFTRYQHDPENPNSLSNNDVYAILEEQSGNLLIGTYGGGLNKFNPQSGQFTVYQFDPDNPDSLSDNDIFNIFKDQAGTIWISTANGGLNRFDPETNEFFRFTQEHGLASDVVYGIVEDYEGMLWLSTNKGLSKFNPQTNTFINYDTSDGLERILYQQNGYFKNNKGELFFGGINGLIKFNPADVQDNSHVPPIILTDFSLFNSQVDFGKPLNEVGTIELSYEDDVFSFEFAALDYANPAKNQYAYKLEGFDDDWIPAGSRTFASYTNIDPGHYTFRVKGSNNAGLWNEEGTAIEITITPPFWETWWFRTIAILVGISLALGGYKIRVRAIKDRGKALEKEVKQRTSDLSEANQRLQELTDRLQDEVLLAQEIQQSLLPPSRPNWSGPDVICYTQPAHEVGGDFYTYHAFGKQRFALFVGDVSGKGMPAALLMAVSVGSLQSIMGQSPEAGDLLARLHQTLRPYNETTKQNCALCYAEILPAALDSATKGTDGTEPTTTLRVLNAGGITPLVRRTDGTVTWIDALGFPLGVSLNTEFNHREVLVTLARGDMVILISDGVVEATTSNRELFGFDRLKQAVTTGPQSSAEAMLTHIKTRIADFMGDDEPHDDLTIVVLQV